MANPWIDISYPIENGVPQWPGDTPICIRRICDIGPDSVVQITKLDLLSHFMTHVDAPRHFIAGGETVDTVSLDRWSGDAIVVAVEEDRIEEWHIPNNCAGLCVLFKTRNWELFTHRDFQENYVCLTPEAAQTLVDRGTKLVGVDYMSVDPYSKEAFPAHYTLLGNGITILESVDLRHVEPGEYELVAFPLKIVDCDGSPVRAALRKR